MSDVIVQSLIIAGVTAVATGYVSARVVESRMVDLAKRIERIEHFLNGLLTQHNLNRKDEGR